jgi:hypothetical protein
MAVVLAAGALCAAACSSSSGGGSTPTVDSGKHESGKVDSGRRDSGKHDAGNADSSKLDSSSDVVELIDTSLPPRDANPYRWNDAASSCQPNPATGFTPVTVAPVKNPVCTTAQIAGLVTQCFDPITSTGSGCDTWTAVPENNDCLTGCPVISEIASTPALRSPPPAPAGPWGPLVEVVSQNSMVFLNIGGCVAAADPSAAGQGCASAINAQFECEYYVCAGNCPVPDSPDAKVVDGAENAFQGCIEAADSGPCSTYVQAANTCIAALPTSSPEEFCLDGSLMSGDPASFDPAFEQLIGEMCGGKPAPDAGAIDAGHKDASGASPADGSAHEAGPADASDAARSRDASDAARLLDALPKG